MTEWVLIDRLGECWLEVTGECWLEVTLELRGIFPLERGLPAELA